MSDSGIEWLEPANGVPQTRVRISPSAYGSFQNFFEYLIEAKLGRGCSGGGLSNNPCGRLTGALGSILSDAQFFLYDKIFLGTTATWQLGKIRPWFVRLSTTLVDFRDVAAPQNLESKLEMEHDIV